MGGIYVVRGSDGFMWHDIHTKFQDDLHTYSSYIKVTTSKIWQAAVFMQKSPSPAQLFLVSGLVGTHDQIFVISKTTDVLGNGASYLL
jgi:hypothetical protein